MKASDIMTRDVISTSPSAKVVEIGELLFKHGFHGLPVLENDKLAGIITENDFFIKDPDIMFLPSYIHYLEEIKSGSDNLSPEKKSEIKKLLNLEARDIMTKDVVTIPPDMEVEEILEFIKKTRFNTLPVADSGNNLLGIVTLVDVIGMVKQGRDAGNAFKARTPQELTKDIDLKNWKVIASLILAVGAVAVIIWMAFHS